MQFYEFGKSRGVTYVNNTFIGGVSSTINTASLLATKLQYYPSGLAFDVADIHNFTIDGDDIECYIDVDYYVANFAFNTSVLTYYKDINGYCKLLNRSAFSIVPNCEELYFPQVITIEPSTSNWSFQGNAITTMYFPNCLNWGLNDAYETDMFRSNWNGISKFYVHPTMETINAGGVEGDLAYAKSLNVGSSILYVTNFTPPNAVTDLAVNTVYATSIKLEWTEPTNLNGIDYYEIYVDGVLNTTTSTLNVTISGLTNLQTYNFTVIAVDNFYNKSLVSNTVTQQINGVDPVFSDPSAFISYYKFENNVLDSVGTNNGTATAITYATGKVGNAGVFNGTTSKITNTPILSYNSFSMFCWIKTTQTTEKIIFSNRYTLSGNPIIIMAVSAGKLYTRLRSNAATGITTLSSSNTVNDGNWRFVGFTFNKITGLQQNYVDGIANTSITYSGGDFGNVNISSIGVGEVAQNYGFWNGSLDDYSFFNKALSQAEVTEIYNIQNAGFELI